MTNETPISEQPKVSYCIKLRSWAGRGCYGSSPCHHGLMAPHTHVGWPTVWPMLWLFGSNNGPSPLFLKVGFVTHRLLDDLCLFIMKGQKVIRPGPTCGLLFANPTHSSFNQSFIVICRTTTQFLFVLKMLLIFFFTSPFLA